MDSVGALLRASASGTDAADVDPRFDQEPVPAALVYALGLEPELDESTPTCDPPGGPFVVLAGPGVLRTHSVEGLRAVASAANVPVANTWGAKGVLPWDSPHHMGTCGLQARDFELLGFGDYDTIVATGIDLVESPVERFALANVTEIPPTRLGDLASTATVAAGPISTNDLYRRLAAVAQPGYVDDRLPMHPARAIADLRAALPPSGIVTADPGLAGLWVARAFPTTEPGSVIVPAVVVPGLAAAVALVAALRGRPVVTVTTEPIDRATLALLELASDLGAAMVVDVWCADAAAADVDDHRRRLGTAFEHGGVTRVDVPVASTRTAELVAAAGPVVAWGGALAIPGAER